MEDDSDSFKSYFRCARAEIELREWAAAAHTVDNALTKCRGRKVDDADVSELWKLAEEVSKSLPDFKWSSSKPPPRKEAEDFEKRIVGHWEYQGGKYEIKIEQWGALIFSEDTIKVDLMRKSKLSWRGEFEMIAGMALVLSYEPGCDVITTEFIPPEDCPEEQKYKGPTRFTAKRAALPPPPKEEPPAEEELPAPAPTPVAPPPPAAVLPSPPPAPAVPDDAPPFLWLSGHDELSGRYEMLPEMLQNGRPVYKRTTGADVFLWYRGGNWVVTKALHSSTLAAPFLVRCGDITGQSRHPLDVRRPRWHVRKGRGQEDLDHSLCLSTSSPTSAEQAGYPPAVVAVEEVPLAPAAATVHASPPVAVIVSGRQGSHEEVNGLYELSSSSSSPMPVYRHSDRQLSLFYITGYWVVAPELCAVPLAIARCPAPGGVRSPMACTAAWEFLCGQHQKGAMVSMTTRTYEKDSSVSLHSPSSSGDAADGTQEEEKHTEEAQTLSSPKEEENWPPWVSDVTVELSGTEVRATVTVREGLSVPLKNLQLDVGTDTLKVGLPNEDTLSLALPVSVDMDMSPVAKLSEKTRTLRVRLGVRS
jgi:hypothetical protein